MRKRSAASAPMWKARPNNCGHELRSGGRSIRLDFPLGVLFEARRTAVPRSGHQAETPRRRSFCDLPPFTRLSLALLQTVEGRALVRPFISRHAVPSPGIFLRTLRRFPPKFGRVSAEHHSARQRPRLPSAIPQAGVNGRVRNSRGVPAFCIKNCGELLYLGTCIFMMSPIK